MNAALPAQVFLYLKSRKGDKRFVLMDTHFNDDTLAWTLSPTTGSQSFHFVQPPLDHSYGEYLGQFTLTTTTNILIKKALRKHLDIKIASPSGLEALVVSLTGHTVVFGSHTLKQNVVFTHTATPTLTATPTVTGTISHVPSMIVKKKSDQLCVFVAKKLMTLAILEKEQCPITVEDFSEGNTAVMPCGHLFMQSAIEEAFKSEPTKCPWCRQPGRPQYV